MPLAAVLLWAPVAARAAESDVAAEMFRAGSRAFARGEFRAAALSFEEAHRRAPHAAAVFNAGLAWEGAGEKARAADAYAEALARKELGAAQGKDARGRLDELRRSLVGLVRLSGPASILVSVAHVNRRALPVEVHLPPGEHNLTFEHPDGTRENRRLALGAAESATQSVLERPARQHATAGIASRPSDAPPPQSRALRITGWTLLGTAAVAAGLAAYLGSETLAANATFEDSKYTNQAAHDRAVRLRTGTNLTWAGSAALAITGAILIWRY